MIRLGQLLKLSGVVDAGGELKDFLASEPVAVNGEPEDRQIALEGVQLLFLGGGVERKRS